MRTPSVHMAILIAFLVNIFGPLPVVQAQDYYLPPVGMMVPLSPEFNPPILKGIKVYPDNPFRFEFILDKGDGHLSADQLKDESNKLIKYFLASLTIPEKDLWVNLSPYEKDRIIPNSFGLTEMGRDLLAEDYMLKQVTASLIYPEDEIGKKFWKRIYEEAAKKYGTTNIPVNTFNKVWIMPQKAVVYENAKAGTAYVVDSKLKVMLEQDYLSLEKHEGIRSIPVQSKETNQLGSEIVREIVIPELTKEVNENKNFIKLRQVYNSLILATWYKEKIKESILSQVYADKSKVAGVNIDDPKEKERIYQKYLKAFKKGVYSYIKEEPDLMSNAMVPRKYFSGGWEALGIRGLMEKATNAQADIAVEEMDSHHAMRVTAVVKEAFSRVIKALNVVKSRIPDEITFGVADWKAYPMMTEQDRDGTKKYMANTGFFVLVKSKNKPVKIEAPNISACTAIGIKVKNGKDEYYGIAHFLNVHEKYKSNLSDQIRSIHTYLVKTLGFKDGGIEYLVDYRIDEYLENFQVSEKEIHREFPRSNFTFHRRYLSNHWMFDGIKVSRSQIDHVSLTKDGVSVVPNDGRLEPSVYGWSAAMAVKGVSLDKSTNASRHAAMITIAPNIFPSFEGSQAEVYQVPGVPNKLIKIFKQWVITSEDNHNSVRKKFEEVYEALIKDPKLKGKIVEMEFVDVEIKGRRTWGIVMPYYGRAPYENARTLELAGSSPIFGDPERMLAYKDEAHRILREVGRITESKYGLDLADWGGNLRGGQYLNLENFIIVNNRLICIDPINYEGVSRISNEMFLMDRIQQLMEKECNLFVVLYHHQGVLHEIGNFLKKYVVKDAVKNIDFMSLNELTASVLFRNWFLRGMRESENGKRRIKMTTNLTSRLNGLRKIAGSLNYKISVQILNHQGVYVKEELKLNQEDVDYLRGQNVGNDARLVIEALAARMERIREQNSTHIDLDGTTLGENLTLLKKVVRLYRHLNPIQLSVVLKQWMSSAQNLIGGPLAAAVRPNWNGLRFEAPPYEYHFDVPVTKKMADVERHAMALGERQRVKEHRAMGVTFRKLLTGGFLSMVLGAIGAGCASQDSDLLARDPEAIKLKATLYSNIYEQNVGVNFGADVKNNQLKKDMLEIMGMDTPYPAKFSLKKTWDPKRKEVLSSIPEVAERIKWLENQRDLLNKYVQRVLETMTRYDKNTKLDIFTAMESPVLAERFVFETLADSNTEMDFRKTIEYYLKEDFFSAVLMPDDLREELFNNRRIYDKRARGKPFTDRPVALVALDFEHDWNGGFKHSEIKHEVWGKYANNRWIKDLIDQGYFVLYVDVNSFNKLMRYLGYFTEDGRLSILVLGGHGSPTSFGDLLVTTDKSKYRPKSAVRIDRNRAKMLAEIGLANLMTPDGKIILESCSAGGECVDGPNVDDIFGEMFHFPVYAATKWTTKLTISRHGSSIKYYYGDVEVPAYIAHPSVSSQPSNNWVPDKQFENTMSIIKSYFVNNKPMPDSVHHAMILAQGELLANLKKDLGLDSGETYFLEHVIGVDYFALYMSGINFISHQSDLLHSAGIPDKLISIINVPSSRDILKGIRDKFKSILETKDLEIIKKYNSLFSKACARYYFNGLHGGGLNINDLRSPETQEVSQALDRNETAAVPGAGVQGIFMIAGRTRGKLYLIDSNPFIVNMLTEYINLNNSHARDQVILGDAGGEEWSNDLLGKIDLVSAERVLHEIGRTQPALSETEGNQENAIGLNDPRAIDSRRVFYDNISRVLAPGGQVLIGENDEWKELIPEIRRANPSWRIAVENGVRGNKSTFRIQMARAFGHRAMSTKVVELDSFGKEESSITDLSNWLKQNDTILWQAGQKYGEVHASVKLTGHTLNVYASDQMKKDFSEIANFDSNRGGYYPPPGSYGQIKFRFFQLDHQPVLVIQEIQPSDGFRAIKNPDHRKQLDGWRKTVIEKLIEWAEPLGIGCYVYNSSGIRNVYPAISWQEAKSNYDKPFEQDQRWEPIVARIPTEIQTGDIDFEPFFGMRKYLFPTATQNRGGIDLTPAHGVLQTQNGGEEIKFHMNPAMLAQLQNAPGFVPIVINIQPMTDLRQFLGLNVQENVSSVG